MRLTAGILVASLALLMSGCSSSPRTEPMDLPVFEVPDEGTDLPGETGGPEDLPQGDRPQGSDEGPGDPGSGHDTSSPPDEASTDPGQDSGAKCQSTSECPLGFLCIDGDCLEGCLSDRDCPRDRHCKADEPPHGRCLACLTSEHCLGNQTCIFGNCVATCRSGADCQGTPETPLCDTTSGLCVACLTETDCPLGSLCMDRRCLPGCRSDRDCPPPQKCDRSYGSNGGCFPCIQDGDCGDKVCRDHQCVIDCSLIRCPTERPVCDPVTGACLQCLRKEDCPRGHLCIQNVCQPGCETDLDCGSSLHCGNGSCVPCTEDRHCQEGQKCRSFQCTSAECSRDTDCGNREYCHPLLSSCEALPSNACSSNDNCLSIFPGFLDQACDPLTRQCIPSCLMGVGCLDLLGTGRTVCVDNACYGCGSDSDCPGVRCDPFDRFCRACRDDSDCAVPGWHCAQDGSCYACLDDRHCSFPQVCDVAGSRRCVDCLSDRDCKTPGKPICGKSKTCIAPCVNECSSGQKICDPGDLIEPIGILTCGDVDDDPCLEYGNGSSCGTASTCRTQSDGSGRCVCTNECTSGQKRCASGDPTKKETCTQSSTSGCWYWSASYCGSGEVCSNGTCTCGNECSLNQAWCESSTKLWSCEADSYTGCPVWVGYTCNPGYTCSNGTCR